MKLHAFVPVSMAAAVVAGAGVWFGLSGPRAARPHVVLISIDTLRADHLGCYGYSRETSPNIDALAKAGVRFADAFAQSSWTLPSHMSIMTSQYPHVHGVQTGRRALPESATTLAEVLSEAGYHTAAFVSWMYVDRKFGFAQGFDEFTELIPPKERIDSTTRWSFKAEQVTDAVAAWLRGRGAEPVFLFVHYFDPHINYAPPPPFDTMFDPEYRGEASGSFHWLRPYIKGEHRKPNRIAPRDLEHVRALYDGEIRYTDTHVGRLLDAIDASLGLDNCLLVLTSDHGEEFNEHGSMEGHQWTLYDEVLRIPLIFRLPGRAYAGSVVKTPVQSIDIATTILDWIGTEAPPAFQGRSLVGLIKGTERPAVEPIVLAETRRFNRKQCVRGPRYKLIHTDDIGLNKRGVPVIPGYELFDVQKDPLEQNNIYDASSPIAKFLVSRLESLRAEKPGATGATERGEEVRLSEEERQRLRSLGYLR